MYFDENYIHLRLPHDSDQSPGLRNAQLGAIHAIASHFSLKDKPAIISLPTGSGKTAVLMMAPYLLGSKRVLVVTPSKLVRAQIADDYRSLNTLKKLGVFDVGVPSPKVHEVTSVITTVEKWHELSEFDVVVGTPKCLSPAETGVAKPPDDLFDLVLVDEAHHSPAKTWNALLDGFPQSARALFTATPFRQDRRLIKGDMVYVYPTQKAFEDGIFGVLEFIPVVIKADANHDIAIAIEAERRLRSDREGGFKHLIMVRTDRRNRAKELQKIYEDNTNLKLGLIHSGLSLKHVSRMVQKLRALELDGIICVDMLGEGFDLPNLKIAAIHAPHKSLAVTLQFIGRFARTGIQGIGTAKFIAIPNDIEIEAERLYDEGTAWHELIPKLGSEVIQRETEIRAELETFETNIESAELLEEFSLATLRPYFHARIYRTFAEIDLRIDPPFLDQGLEIVLSQYSEDLNTTILITRDVQHPKWHDGEEFDYGIYDLHIVYFDKDEKLLFIQTTIRSDNNYAFLIEHYAAGHYNALSMQRINNALAGLDKPEFFHVGMKNRIRSSNIESYRIIAGRRAHEAISQTDGQLYDRGHAFGRGKSIGDTNEMSTLGISSASKIWSHRYGTIPEFVKWCRWLASNIKKNARVTTGSNLDYLDVGLEIEKLPETVIGASWHIRTLFKDYRVEWTPGDITTRQDIADIDLQIISGEKDSNQIKLNMCSKGHETLIEIGLFKDEFRISVKGIEPNIAKGEADGISVSVFLKHYPLDFYLADLSRLTGIEWYQTSDADPFSPDRLTVVDWTANNVDIEVEVDEAGVVREDGKYSIQQYVEKALRDRGELAIHDHRSGEIADYISLGKRDGNFHVTFYHCKKSGGANPGERVADYYEVVCQGVKSSMWFGRANELHSRLAGRIKTGSRIIDNKAAEFEQYFKEAGSSSIRYDVVLVQPGISKSKMTEKGSTLLAAADDFLRRARGERLSVWVSS
ncbi:MAG TPA: DEAD/DEAH box helicase family protein [Ktedonobacteraceae bacterium]|nr:DEAD/DEAH box helicase family protein [Ktedonobacteraceae bacterium]